MTKKKPVDQKDEITRRAGMSDKLAEATGTDDYGLSKIRFNEVSRTIRVPAGAGLAEQRDLRDNLIETFANLKPTDAAERMLIGQMLVCHDATMSCFDLATGSRQDVRVTEMYLKLGAKLMSTYAKHVETLDKHRGKGQQKVTVEHVYVAPGGQAFVGNVEGSASGGSHQAAQSQMEHTAEVPPAFARQRHKRIIEK